MKRLLLSALAAIATPSALPAADAPAPMGVETLASFPSGTFLENLTAAADGSVVFTSYFDKSLQRLKDGKLQEPLAKLDVHPVGIIAVADGYVVTAHGKPFTDAPAFLSTNSILLLSRDGEVRKVYEAPAARFLNGLVALSPTRILIADSVAGLIWAFDPADGKLSPWLEDERLTLDPAVQPFRPAANGLKLHGDMLYISNSSRGALYRVKLDAAGEAISKLETFVQPGPIDDFAFDTDGTIYATTHGDKLLKIAPDGTRQVVMEDGCDACTSVAIVGEKGERSLLVLTTGKLFEGGKLPARILQIRLR